MGFRGEGSGCYDEKNKQLDAGPGLLLTVIPTGAGGIHVFAAAPKLIAFTFDDGPSIYTAGLLDGLKEREPLPRFL